MFKCVHLQYDTYLSCLMEIFVAVASEHSVDFVANCDTRFDQSLSTNRCSYD